VLIKQGIEEDKMNINNTFTYKCDICEQWFAAMAAKFVDPMAGIIFGAGFAVKCLCKDGEIRGKRNPKKSMGDRILACPFCDSIHIRNFE
jgi:hypothetical protein